MIWPEDRHVEQRTRTRGLEIELEEEKEQEAGQLAKTEDGRPKRLIRRPVDLGQRKHKTRG